MENDLIYSRVTECRGNSQVQPVPHPLAPRPANMGAFSMFPFQTSVHDCLTCGQTCCSSGGLTCHMKAKHPKTPVPSESKNYKHIYHRNLNGTSLTLLFNTYLQFAFILARPCTADGSFLPKPIPTPTTPDQPPNTSSDNPWAPFQDRLAFDWAHYHYVRLQSSESNILEGLDLWRATVIKHQSQHEPLEGIPWNNINEFHATIDSIAVGGVGWKSYKFRYTGPKPAAPPQWMEETYDLNARDVLAVLEHQIGSTQFDSQFDYVPYQEYDSTGNRVYSNLMSAFWANREAVGSSRVCLVSYPLTKQLRTPLQKIR